MTTSRQLIAIAATLAVSAFAGNSFAAQDSARSREAVRAEARQAQLLGNFAESADVDTGVLEARQHRLDAGPAQSRATVRATALAARTSGAFATSADSPATQAAQANQTGQVSREAVRAQARAAQKAGLFAVSADSASPQALGTAAVAKAQTQASNQVSGQHAEGPAGRTRAEVRQEARMARATGLIGVPADSQ